jgi:ORF6N domain
MAIVMNKTTIVLAKRVSAKILVLRNQKVILDSDLAELYGVPVRQLNQQVKRNADRFPADFVFSVTAAEYENLRSQNVIAGSTHGGRRYLPHAFTEHGAIMAATVLNSKRAIEMSIFVVRAFVEMRQSLVVNQHVVSKLSELEARLDSHDAEIQDLVEAIRELVTPLPANDRRIGFALPSPSEKKQAKASRIQNR